jgi:hypothetical protein
MPGPPDDINCQAYHAKTVNIGRFRHPLGGTTIVDATGYRKTEMGIPLAVGGPLLGGFR